MADIQRYRLEYDGDHYARMEPHRNGSCVKYTDHQAALATARREMKERCAAYVANSKWLDEDDMITLAQEICALGDEDTTNNKE